MSITKYPDWQQAAEASLMRKAVSEPFEILLNSRIGSKEEAHAVEIVKPLRGDPYLVYAGTGIRVHEKMVNDADCDAVSEWRSY